MKKVLLLILTAFMVACGHNAEPSIELNSEADIAGKRIGYVSGTIYDLLLSPRTDISKYCFNAQTDAVQALVKNQIDIAIDDDCNIPKDEQRRLGIRLALHGEQNFECAFALRKDAEELCAQLSHFIDSLKANGEMQQLYDRWFESDYPDQNAMPDLGADPQGQPIIVCLATNIPPVSFPVGDEWRGFEPEILQRFAHAIGRPLVFLNLPASSAIASL